MTHLQLRVITGVFIFFSSSIMNVAVAQTGGTFSCKINGKLFASKGGTDGLGNLAYRTNADNITFTLVSVDPSLKGGIPTQFSFRIVSKGICSFNAEDSHCLCSASYSPADYPDSYNAQSGTCTITSISANRITGTFLATFSGMQKTFEVTEGRFDLPRSGYSKPLQWYWR